MSAVDRAVQSRLSYLRRELEIAEREAAREPFDVGFLPANQREPFDLANRGIEAARDAIPRIEAEIRELSEWRHDAPSP